MKYSIGIDIGTTTVKCVLFGEGPTVIEKAGKEYATSFPGPNMVQQNPEHWWQGVVESIQTLLAKSGVSPEDIKVMSVSSQAPAMLPLDKNGNVLHEAMIWMDRRSQNELDTLKESIGADRIFHITGNRLDTYFALTELMWMIRNHPELMEKCHKILQVNGYINYKLTGEFTIDASHVTLTQMYDIQKDCWSRELLSAVGASEAIMPRICECDEVIGTLSGETAKLLGLSEKTVVLGGAVDATAAALEVGVIGSGSATEMTGTSSVLTVGCDGLVTNEGLSYLRGSRKDLTLLFGAMNSAGGSLKWFRDALYGGETEAQDAYPRINQEIEEFSKTPTKLIYLPYLAGERSPIWDPYARGSFIGIGQKTSRADMMRAIMEGASYALLHNLEQVDQMGISTSELICCGGCANSDIWLKIKASVINKLIQVPEVNLGAPGGLACIMAAYMGEYATPEEASLANLKIKKIVEPEQEWVKIYQELYPIYKDSYESLKTQFRKLAKVKL